MISIVLRYCAIVLASSTIARSLRIVSVDPTSGNDTTCLDESSKDPCKSLDRAFSLKDYFVTYALSNDIKHYLHNDSIFYNLRNLTIQGYNSSILCNSEAGVGLSFTLVTNLIFEGVTFMHCATLRNSTSKFYNSSNIHHFYLYPFKVGLYLYQCDSVSMLNVEVSSSPEATGVVMYDTGGSVSIKSCIFSNNSVGYSEVGGGGLYIEFSYCKPGDPQCIDNNTYFNITEANYKISDCTFSNNWANNQDGFSNATYIVPFESNHQAFGRGGGLSIFVKGIASNNQFLVTNCHFNNNTAQWGGGGFVEFHDQTDNNSVIFEECTFNENKCEYTLTKGTGGGGMRIGHYVYGFGENSETRHGNTIVLRNCNFTHNSAMYGGGLSVSPTLRNNGRTNFLPAVLNLTDVRFEKNVGKIGAAVHLERFALLTEGTMISVTMQDCVFTSNTVAYAEFLGKHDSPHPVGIGIIYINQVPTSFLGTNEFVRNDGTALAVVGTYVNFSDSSNLFAHNTGYRGGALSLLGSAYIIINQLSQITFLSNLAQDLGGAIYNRYVEMDNLETRTNCFIRHTNPFLGPNNWNASLRFINNTDQKGDRSNSIHTTSILPCFWAGGDGYSVVEDVIFCWKNWIHCNDSLDVCENYSYLNCSFYVSSDPGSISNTSVINTVPGWNFKMYLDITDDYHNDIKQTVVFRTTHIDGSSLANPYFLESKGVVRGAQNSSSNLTLEIVGDRVWEVNLMVNLLPCPPGFRFSVDECVCHNSSSFGNKVFCDIDSHVAKIKERNWIGRINPGDPYLAGSCPLGYCRTSNSSYNNLTNTTNLTNAVCDDNRKGILCGECKDKFGPAINSNSFDCINCTDINRVSNIVKYVALVYLPLTLFFISLIVFDIRLTTGPANGFIVFCQVITSTFDLQANGTIPLHTKISAVYTLRKIYFLIYGVFNLEFFENLVENLCISPHYNALTALSLDYGVAAFPLIIIVFILLLIKLNNVFCSCHMFRKMSQLFHKLFVWRTRPITESFLPAFAAFILLSYTKFTLTSSYMLEKQKLVDEGGTGRSYRLYYAGQYDTSSTTYQYAYFTPSVCVFALVCVTPIVLLVYPLQLLEWCISKFYYLRILYPVDKVHFFLDTFQGCYKNKMCFFAGLYFLFRLVINGAYLATYSWPSQFVIQQLACIVMIALLSICQPYNKENRIFNYVDTLIFINLLVLNSLTFYLYTTFYLGMDQFTVRVFSVQYVLIFLPLLYMLSYLFWLVIRRSRFIKRKLKFIRKHLYSTFFKDSHRKANPTNTAATEQVTLLDRDDELFERAQDTNKYQRAGSKEIRSQEISNNLTENSGDLRITRSTRATEMSRVSLTKSSGNASYGSTGTSSSVRFTTT